MLHDVVTLHRGTLEGSTNVTAIIALEISENDFLRKIKKNVLFCSFNS